MSMICGAGQGREIERICKWCGKPFRIEDEARQAKYCPKPCREEAHKARDRKSSKKRYMAKVAAR